LPTQNFPFFNLWPSLVPRLTPAPQIRQVPRRQYCALYEFIYLLTYLMKTTTNVVDGVDVWLGKDEFLKRSTESVPRRLMYCRVAMLCLTRHTKSFDYQWPNNNKNNTARWHSSHQRLCDTR